MSQKIVINNCCGGFNLSKAAETRYKELTGKKEVWSWEIKRDDPLLIQVVEELGDGADTRVSSLKIVEIPDGVEWIVEEYDGSEWIAEEHRTWA